MDFRKSDMPVPGVEVVADGQRLIVPPLKMGAIRRAVRDGTWKMLGELRTSREMPDDEKLEKIIGLIFEALKRNYPSITIEDMDDLLDLRNVGRFVDAVTASVEETPTPGEARSPTAP